MLRTSAPLIGALGAPIRAVESSQLKTVIGQALDWSDRIGRALIFPTVLIKTDKVAGINKVEAADIALAYLQMHRIFADRVRMNIYGFPGLLRDLSNPPPWIEITPEDCLYPQSPDRQADCDALIAQLKRYGTNVILDRHEEFLLEENQRRAWTVAERGLGERTPSVNRHLEDSKRQSFYEVVSLASSLELTEFDALRNSVFALDEFTVAPGVPDLMLWFENSGEWTWALAEVKAHGDYLSHRQHEWLYENWSTISGHFLLLSLT